MPNPLSSYGLSDIDYAMTVGMVMGEAMNEDLVGMGLIAATGLNRAQNPGAYLARSAALGDIFAAPHAASDLIEGRRTAGVTGARQFSPTINSNIPGASKEGHQNFRAGLEAALISAINPNLAPSLGIRQQGFERAQLATEIAVKARDMGIDLGFGVTNFGAPGFGSKAGVGRNPGRYGGHVVGPFEMNERPPSPQDFAARFAAAAALTGVSIPDQYMAEIRDMVSPQQLAMAASTMQMQAQQHLASLGIEAFPGINYNDTVPDVPFDAVNVPSLVGQYDIAAMGPMGWAEAYGITPTGEYEDISLPDPVGQVDYMGQVAPLDMAQVNPVSFDGRIGTPGTSSFGWGGYGFEGFNAPSLMSQAGFNDRWGAGIPLSSPGALFGSQPLGPPQSFETPEMASLYGSQPMGAPQSFSPGWGSSFEGYNAPGLIDQASFDSRWGAGTTPSFVDMGYPETEQGIVSPGPLGWGEQFGVESSPWDNVGNFHAGFDGWESAPDFNAPSLDARNRMDAFEGAMSVRNQSTPTNEAIAANVMSELAPSRPSVDPKAQADYDRAMDNYERAMGDYNVARASYDKKMDAYEQATKAFSATPTGLPDVPAMGVAPTLMGAATFGSVPGWGVTQQPAKVAAPVKPTAPTMPTKPTPPKPVAPAPVIAPKPVALPPLPARIEIAAAPLAASFSQPSNPYSGFANAQDAMIDIGAGMAAMPAGIAPAWGGLAFGDSVYSAAAYNDVMDAVAKQGGFAPRMGIMDGLMHDLGFNMGGSGGDSFGGYSIGDVTSPDGYASIGAGIDAFMGGLGGLGGWDSGGGGGRGGGGMTGENGGYGNADGSPSNNGPGIW